MKILKKKFSKPLFLIIFVWLLAGLSVPCSMADTYQPQMPVMIMSDAHGPAGDSGSDTLVQWSVVPEKTSSGELSLSYYLADTNQLICRQVDAGSGIRMLWNNTTRVPYALSRQDLLIVPGSNVPCDQLPAAQMMNSNNPVIYEVRRQLGGQAFVDRVQVETVVISPQDALQKGWLPVNAESPDRLVMIQAFNLRTKTLLVKQLWAPGDDWWIYEETPARQSWRVK